LLEEHGPYDFRFTETQAEFEVLWPRLVELHQRRWSGEGQPGCFASPLFTRFHARIGPELASRGMARLAVLSLNGQTVAARYLFANGRRLMCYQSGFDAASAPGVPLGKVLLGLIIEAAIGEGFECLDFLKGVTPHKLSWSKAVHAQVAVRLSRETWREQVRGGIEWGVSRAKAWRRSFRNAQPSVG
jgi:CelD/BcsL family acetyltransferase involved in cellulose biosynthesis